jgi:hypothetical protein
MRGVIMNLDNFEPTSVIEQKDKGNGYTKKELIQCLRHYYERYGDITRRGFAQNDDYPSGSTITYNFGSWNKGIEKACIPTQNKNTRINFTEDMKSPTSEKAYLIGVMLCDGSLSQYNNRTYYELTVKDKDFAVNVTKQFCEWTGLNWDGFHSENTEMSCKGPIELNGNKDDVYRVRKGVNPLLEHLDKYRNMGGEKIINEFKEHKSDLLRGMWDSEGSISTEVGVRFFNSDDKIIHMYMVLVSEVLNLNYNQKGMTYGTKDKSMKYGDIVVGPERGFSNNTREVRISKDHVQKFLDVVEPTIKRKVEVFENMQS